jgi:predicted AAA+ superfamily ATPase
MIKRPRHALRLLSLLRRFPVVGLLGARQVGKTTLARVVAQKWRPAHWFDLEQDAARARLSDPGHVLGGLRGLVVLDEVQAVPGLFRALRVLADRRPLPARFLVLGSASRDLLRQSAETLAGRIAYHELPGLALDEVGAGAAGRLWLRGGFPRSLLAPSEARSVEWRREFITTYVERDLPKLGIAIPGVTIRRFWTMLAHYHGQIWNSSEFARTFGVADTTVRNYLDVLAATFAVRQLPAWHENLGKRQVRAPKIYMADSGILHGLLGIHTADGLENHPKAGASWEGFALDQVIQRTGALPEECAFWATHAGAELDLLIVRGQRRLGFEFKRTDAPVPTRSMHVAMADLKLESLTVVHAGTGVYPMAKGIRAVPLARLARGLPEGLRAT